jgi:hypothetical protein
MPVRQITSQYALSRTLSPVLVAGYKLHLPDKGILRRKIKELTEFAEAKDGESDDMDE